MGNQYGLIRHWVPIFCGFLSTVYSVPLLSAEVKPLIGFVPESASRERTLEAQFDASLAKNNLRDWMQHLTARPHHLGSAFDKENAEFIAEKFRSWGYETAIEEFEVLFPTPKVRVVEMIEPAKFTAALSEPALKEDATSGQVSEQLPVYHAYSIDGDVTAEIVYVNFGIPKDYETLAENGIDVKGKIVLARYGGSWRGIKPKVAAEHGAIGCLIYSDPHEDGFFQGDVYPKDAWRNETGAQRGSVADMPLYPGDPLTPGVGATKDAHRLTIKEAPTLTKIPVLPLSHSDALPLLKALEGSVVPEDWRGALPVTYHFGPGPAKVHLKVEFDWKQVPLFDVIAKLRGNERPDEWIIRGNHHDAWVNGASDPTSGMVVVMEEARAISELLKTGWKPKRTIIFAAWDGEEPGLLGSTEWVETHGEELRKHAALYINSDGNGRGFLNAGGSHSLEKFVNEIARDVQDPQKKISVAERAKALALVKGNPETKKEARDRADFRISALGSGSDYTPFLQHNGIASLNLGFGGEDNGGVYHSIYDSFDHFTRFVDPKFEYGIALAQTAGRAVLRSANADVLPFEFKNLTDSLDKYFQEITKLTDEMREETKQKNQLISDKTLEAVSDPTKTFIVPAVKDPVPFLNFAPLQNALAQLRESAAHFDKLRNEIASGKRTLTMDQQQALDSILLGSERTLIRNEGLPRRPWFKHQIYAPGFYTGYGVKTLPGVREAIEQRDWKEAEEQVPIVAKVIEQFAAEVERAANSMN
ncbi:MAG: folate hydrolase [Verrucomicrobiales bacterium]|nr:folate hydrolase [Verrucomicrobiales bacterium]